MHVSFESRIEVKVVDIVTKYTISSEHAHWGRLCSIVDSNSGVFDREQVAKHTLPSKHQEIIDQGIAHNLWDRSGNLTPDGSAAASVESYTLPNLGLYDCGSLNIQITVLYLFLLNVIERFHFQIKTRVGSRRSP